MKISLELIKKNIYWVISLILFGLVVIFSFVMLITLEVSADVDETTLGFIVLSNHSDEEKKALILQGIQTWEEQAQFTLHYQEYHVSLDLDMFVFEVDETMDSLVPNQRNLASFSLNDSEIAQWMNTLSLVVGPTIMNHFDQVTFFDHVLGDVMSLSRIQTYELTHYLSQDIMGTVIHSAVIDSISAFDVNEITSKLNDIVILGLSRFSLLDTLSDLSLSNEQLSIIASGMLGVIHSSNMTSFDFEIYQYLPSWASQGQNVRILQVNGYDLSFYNGLNTDFTIRITEINASSLRFELIGYPYITQYQTTTTISQVIDYQTIIHDDETIDALTPGVIITETAEAFIYDVIVQTGVNGMIYETIRTKVPYQDEPSATMIYYEHYFPIDEIIHRHIVLKGD